MPDRDVPRMWRKALQVLRAGTYGALIWGGVAALVWPPLILEGRLSVPVTLTWAFLALLGGATSFTGVIIGRYRVEWVGVGVTVMAGLAHTVGAWSLVVTESPILQTQAVVSTAMTAMLAHRTVELTVHADRMRREHEERVQARREVS